MGIDTQVCRFDEMVKFVCECLQICPHTSSTILDDKCLQFV